MVENGNVVPVWTLATKDAPVPPIPEEGSMTATRLAELRTALAALVDAPLATLEAHPLPEAADLSGGSELGSSSPLASLLSELIDETSVGGSALRTAGGVLFRLIVPAKVAAQVGTGLGTSTASPIGAPSVLDGVAGAVGKSNFIPVAGKLAGGGGVGALTVAAPLVFMAIAAGLNALAERDRRGTDELIEEYKQDALRAGRAHFNACIAVLDTAANVLLDEGRVGASLGLDAAAFQINVGLAQARGRIEAWERSVKSFTKGRAEVPQLQKEFRGIGEADGEFYAQLEFAKLSFELSKRLGVLQAVEHAQLDSANSFENFTRALARNNKAVDALQGRLSVLLQGLSDLEVDRSHGVRDFVFKSGEVDTILQTSRRVRGLGNEIVTSDLRSDVAIEVARKADGSLVVMPAVSL
ncbi:hypothetical protein [Rhodococcoides fascians]|uniref:hypothetical protein n=1 Tax=Rhodococcoides fascians TaxID=1828 RepID=UPI00050CB768|nr:hypothetical protein [Rhodococcus fascians]